MVKNAGATLKGENAETVWDPDCNNEIEYPRVNKLIVKQILLGVEAAENEYNVIEVSAINLLHVFYWILKISQHPGGDKI